MSAQGVSAPALQAPQAGASYLQVQTTTDSRAEAMELARAAVEARLAACAQVAGPIASTYWWEGTIERAEEWLLLMKLPAGGYQALADFITRRHSYDEPEIVALPIVGGSESYLSWIEDETRQELPAGRSGKGRLPWLPRARLTRPGRPLPSRTGCSAPARSPGG